MRCHRLFWSTAFDRPFQLNIVSITIVNMFAEYHRSPIAQDGKTSILVACICLGDWFFQEILTG
ncbi:hypothetical protein C491_09359 [Natronococcus amylolyticus DSM 10524]|uniref:Uncharacterized protein n=1 Tax=Natronococcus amylolyticus DSM 10524 TaxID=1227497 RepID=L9X9A0_9EURY|nr:hypothetical protein C491_09359 [Natronococcus amylolyticus DSM 10524]